MKIVMLITAEYATVESGTGKLNIMGVFNRFRVETPGEALRRVYLVTRIRGRPADSPSAHQLTVTLTDPSEATLVERSGNFNMPASTQSIDPECDFVLEFNQLEFKQEGIYRFSVNVDDGKAQASTMIQVLPLEA